MAIAQKTLMKIAYWLVGISVLIVIGMTLYIWHLRGQQTDYTVTEEITEFELPGE